MQAALAELLQLLELERLEINLFRGASRDIGSPQVFGGQVLGQALRAQGSYELFKWHFDSKRDDVRIHGRIEAPRAAFVGLTYLNPPGGSKICLNSKVAQCEVTLERAGRAQTFATRSRAAFEILTDDPAHGVPVLAS